MTELTKKLIQGKCFRAGDVQGGEAVRKELAVECACQIMTAGHEELREWRVMLAGVLRQLESQPQTDDARFACGYMASVLDSLAVAEEVRRWAEEHNERQVFVQ